MELIKGTNLQILVLLHIVCFRSHTMTDGRLHPIIDFWVWVSQLSLINQRPISNTQTIMTGMLFYLSLGGPCIQILRYYAKMRLNSYLMNQRKSLTRNGHTIRNKVMEQILCNGKRKVIILVIFINLLMRILGERSMAMLMLSARFQCWKLSGVLQRPNHNSSHL